MKNRNGTLMSVADFRAGLAKAPEKLFAVAGDERLLARLPKGNWVGGTIPYLMTDEDGGLTTRDSLMVQELVTGELFADKALACHVSLPAGKTADVEIVNIFERSEGPDIRFETDGFGPVTDCTIDGKKTNFARWLTDNNVDTKLPLVADYNGAL